MINLPKIKDPRGNLSFIQSGAGGACPFEIESVAWCYDIPGGNDAGIVHDSDRYKLVAALSGSFKVDEEALYRSDRGIISPAGEGVAMQCFSTNSVALILESGTENCFEPAREDDPLIPIDDVHRLSDVALARIIDLPRVPLNDGGSITTVANGDGTSPFNIRRIFYLYDVPADAERGGHSHYVARELIVAMSGSFDVVLDDGKHEPRRFTLNRPYRALYIPAGLWRTLDNFSGGAVSTVLTSHRFSEPDYVRDYETFLRLCRCSK